MGARVPVLKYKCALSGLDCDVSVQGSGALVKANIIKIINQHCPALSPLYRCRAITQQDGQAQTCNCNSTDLCVLWHGVEPGGLDAQILCQPFLLDLPVHCWVVAVCKHITDFDYLLCAACGVMFGVCCARLVKLWAAAHDLNDASRSTFNSTSLLYLTMFYLQLQQLLPPLKELVESNLLNAPSCHLLHPSNK